MGDTRYQVSARRTSMSAAEAIATSGLATRPVFTTEVGSWAATSPARSSAKVAASTSTPPAATASSTAANERPHHAPIAADATAAAASVTCAMAMVFVEIADD